MWHCSGKSLCLYVALTAKTHTKKASENTKNTQVTFVHYDYPGSYPLTRQSSKSSALLMINWSCSCMDSRLPSSRLHASQSQLQAASSPQGSARATSANNNKGFSTSAKLLYIIVTERTERKKFYYYYLYTLLFPFQNASNYKMGFWGMAGSRLFGCFNKSCQMWA